MWARSLNCYGTSRRQCKYIIAYVSGPAVCNFRACAVHLELIVLTIVVITVVVVVVVGVIISIKCAQGSSAHEDLPWNP